MGTTRSLNVGVVCRMSFPLLPALLLVQSLENFVWEGSRVAETHQNRDMTHKCMGIDVKPCS